MNAARLQYNGNVNVEVDSASSVDLSKILQDVRDQYEAMALKNKQELERWYQAKVRWEAQNDDDLKAGMSKVWPGSLIREHESSILSHL